MDRLKCDAFCQSFQVPNSSSNPLPPVASGAAAPSGRNQPNSSQRSEVDDKDCITARKLQKADREKLRRNRLNEHFVELGNVLDPDRPKNDKGTILSDAIQLLKDLTAQVDKLKAEYDSLTEESRELTQEKNDLREEKASLKSDVDNLNAQYQEKLRAMNPWAAMDHSVMMPSPYPFPVPMPMPMPPGAISMQPYPFFGNQSPGVLPNPCSTFVPYMAPSTLVEQQSTHGVHPVQPGTRSHIPGKQDLKNNPSGESQIERSKGSNDVGIELELKTPGSTADQEISSGKRKSKKSSKKERNVAEASFLSGHSSSRSVQDSSSNSIVGGEKAAG